MTDKKKSTPLMQSNATSYQDPAQLREQAERKANAIPFHDLNTMTYEIIQQRFHELQVKQIETELQNEQLRSQLEERNSEDRLFKIVTENMLDLVALTDMQGNFIFAGKSHDILGYEPGFLIGKNVMDFVHPEDLPRILEEFGEFIASGHPRTVEYRNRCKDGIYLWLETMGIFIKDKNGISQKIVFSSRNITERKQAEEALWESEERFQKMLSLVPDMISIHDTDMNIVYSNWNGFGAVPGDKRILQTKCYQTYRGYDAICPDCQARTVLETGKSLQEECKLSNGRWIDRRAIAIMGENGAVDLFVVWVRDITKQKQAEEALLENKNLVESIIDGTPDILAFQLADHSIERFNQAGYKLLGLTPKEVKGRKCYELIGRNRTCDDCATRKAVETGKLEEIEQYFPELGLYFHCRSNPVLDKDGKTVRIIQHLRDITKNKEADKEREKLRSQLNQAQKMESVGRLAGGIAHDFNNKLAIINGYAEMAIDMMGTSDPLREAIQEIYTAGNQSALIVRQLLAFARKQTISPLLLDLNDTISSMLKMLQRLIGENIHLTWHPGSNPWPVKIDPSQVDQVMANLAVNSRDAISNVGIVTIETKNTIVDEDYCKRNPEAIPGRYVMLSVSDDGCGIETEVMDQLFEPFFTTKETGKGTGLGLPTVYGIVKQNKGFVTVYSEPGEGTTFKIYLPSHEAERSFLHSVKESGGDVLMGSETILLVEDEPAILKMGKAMIERLGYTVLSAENPNDALRAALEYNGTIDLLITDVIMPKMNGRDLSFQLAKNHLGLKTLYMSGYTADVIAHHGVLDEGVQFIQKPFLLKDLAVKVREVIEQV